MRRLAPRIPLVNSLYPLKEMAGTKPGHDESILSGPIVFRAAFSAAYIFAFSAQVGFG